MFILCYLIVIQRASASDANLPLPRIRPIIKQESIGHHHRDRPRAKPSSYG
jgi:hypothetical protein